MEEWWSRCIFIAVFAAVVPGSVHAQEELLSSLEDPPENPGGDEGSLKIFVGNRSVPTSFMWDPPNIEYEKFLLRLELMSIPPGEKHVDRVQDFYVQDTRLSVGSDLLLPGGTYKVTLYTQVAEELSQLHEEANFTLNPVPPERLIMWYKNTTALLFIWEPPPGIFKEYKVMISPPDSPKGTLQIPKDLYQKGEATVPGFVGLVPGRSYTISLYTVTSEQLESVPVVTQARTFPEEVSNISVSLLSSSRILVQWVPPEEGEYDGFSILLKSEDHSSPTLQKKFIPRDKNQTQTILELEKSLDQLQEEVSPRRLALTVQTVSGRIASPSAPHYLP